MTKSWDQMSIREKRAAMTPEELAEFDAFMEPYMKGVGAATLMPRHELDLHMDGIRLAMAMSRAELDAYIKGVEMALSMETSEKPKPSVPPIKESQLSRDERLLAMIHRDPKAQTPPNEEKVEMTIREKRRAMTPEQRERADARFEKFVNVQSAGGQGERRRAVAPAAERQGSEAAAGAEPVRGHSQAEAAEEADGVKAGDSANGSAQAH